MPVGETSVPAAVVASADPASTGTRLAAALLGYFALITLVITLGPFDFAPPRRVRLSLHLSPADMLANIALFLPLGVLLASLRPRADHRASVALLAAFSVGIELAQIFIRDRYVSPVDVATNTIGAWAGVLLRQRLLTWSRRQPDVLGRLGLELPLVGLLYLLLPQLWLSGAGMVVDVRRSVTTLLLGAAGSIVLASLHRHRWAGGVRVAAHLVPPFAVVWLALGALPALLGSPRTFGAIAVAVLGVTWVLVRGGEGADERRFEVATLRRFLPVFALYLLASALWPPFRPWTSWHGALGFADRLDNAGVLPILLLLEQVGAFTLLGYATAEWRGRRELTLRQDAPALVSMATALAAALELAQGLLAGPGASLVRSLLSAGGAAYGVALYHLARRHVRAWRAWHVAGAGRADSEAA